MTLRVGIIGAGQVGERHALGFAATPGAAVTAFADVVPARAEAMAARFGARAFGSWQAMLRSGVDAVVVCTPHNLHVEPALAAAELGVHVLMEKPIATTIEDGRRIVDACERAAVTLGVSFVHRFRDELQAAHAWIASGAIGRPLLASEVMNAQRGAHLPRWVAEREAAGGGVLMYSAIHAVDRLIWLLGQNVRAVTAHTQHFEPDTEVEDIVAALLVFDGGAAATLSTSAPVYRSAHARWETEIHGSGGMLRVRTRHWAELSSDADVLRVEAPGGGTPAQQHYNFARQAQDFAAAIAERRPPAVTGEDGLRALAVALAIYRAAETGATVQPESTSYD